MWHHNNVQFSILLVVNDPHQSMPPLLKLMHAAAGDKQPDQATSLELQLSIRQLNMVVMYKQANIFPICHATYCKGIWLLRKVLMDVGDMLQLVEQQPDQATSLGLQLVQGGLDKVAVGTPTTWA